MEKNMENVPSWLKIQVGCQEGRQLELEFQHTSISDTNQMKRL